MGEVGQITRGFFGGKRREQGGYIGGGLKMIKWPVELLPENVPSVGIGQQTTLVLFSDTTISHDAVEREEGEQAEDGYGGGEFN